MRHKMNMSDKAEARAEFAPTTCAGMSFSGHFTVECVDADGTHKWTESTHNIVTSSGLDHALNVIFHGTSNVSPWYVLLKGSGAPAAADTLASPINWTEFSDYTGNRQEYVETAAAAQSITNSASPASFSITGAGTVAGAGLSSVATGSAGILWCDADFANPRSVDNGDTLNVTYTISAADDGE